MYWVLGIGLLIGLHQGKVKGKKYSQMILVLGLLSAYLTFLIIPSKSYSPILLGRVSFLIVLSHSLSLILDYANWLSSLSILDGLCVINASN
jgi:hypothetical protein